MKNILAFLALMAFAGCTNAVFSDTVSFTGNRWPQQESPAFDFEIGAPGKYDIHVELSHVYGGIPLASVPMKLSVTGAQSDEFDFDLEIIKDGKQIGDCTGDYCDLSAKVASMELAAGSYKATISQGFDHEFLPNVIRAGISVRKSQ